MPKSASSWKIAGVVILLLATIATGWMTIKARRMLRAWDAEKARDSGNPIPVRTVQVEESKVDETVGATAVTIPAESATIRVVQGSAVRVVKAVNVRLGSIVKQGEVLFEFDEDLFRQAVEQRRAALAAAEEELKATQELRSKNAASGLDLTNAKVRVETARLDLVMAEQELKDCKVIAPIGGVVADVQAVPGEKVDTTIDITQIHSLDPILVQMDFPQERIDSLTVGQPAELVLDSFPQESFTGKVLRISPVADAETRVLPVMVEVPNPDHRIKAGLTGFVRIQVSKRGKTIPAAALIRSGGKAMAFRVENQRARVREVRPGPVLNNGMVEVLSGLDTGDEVVLFGNSTLQDNDRVDTDWRRWANR